jgi:hypothetical protein
VAGIVADHAAKTRPTSEAGLVWSPGAAFTLAGSPYAGRTEYLPGGTTPLAADRTLVDLVATFNATPRLTFLMDLDWDRQDPAFGANSPDSATWYGAAG